MKFKLIIIATGIVVMLLNLNCQSALPPSEQAIQSRIENSPRYEDGKFNHNGNVLNMSIKDYAHATWEWVCGDTEATPKTSLPVRPVELAHFKTQAPRQLNVTWLGHSSLMINIDGYKILTDPVFFTRLSILGPSRFNGDVPLDIDQLPAIDAVIISHDHYDHLSKPSILFLQDRVKKFIVPLGVGARLVDWGVPREQIVELDWWEAYRLDHAMRFVATPAQHFSGRGVTDRNKTLWASWVVVGPTHKIFFSGDSGYFEGFKQIGDQYGPFDMTFIECGAYNEAWHGVHLFPEETVQANLDLRGRVLHPIHWGTFNLSVHAWYEPMQRLAKAAAALNVETATPIVGQTTVWGQSVPTVKWWEPLIIESKETVINKTANARSNAKRS
jgi:L-ascorbate metabolism protein UlaG (beta-lactamase superfamily)